MESVPPPRFHLSRDILGRQHRPEMQREISRWGVERQLGISGNRAERFKFIEGEVRVPLKPQHTGNFTGYQVGKKVTDRTGVSALAVEPYQQRCILAGRANGIIDVYPLQPLSHEFTGDEDGYEKEGGRYKFTPTHSTAFHPPYDFSHQNEVTRVRFCDQTSSLFSSVSLDGNFTLYDCDAMRPTFRCDLESPAYTVANSPGGLGPYASLFAAGIMAGHVPLIDPRTPLPVMRFTSSKGPTIALSWHPRKANMLFCGGADSKILLWDIRGGPGKAFAHLAGEDTGPAADIGATVGLCTSSDGEHIVSHHHRHLPATQSDTASNKFILKVWNLRTLELLVERAIPGSVAKSAPSRVPKPSTVEPVFYTRQRRSRPKPQPNPAPTTPAKRKRPELPTETLLSHNIQSYPKLPIRNLDPDLGHACFSGAEGQQLGLPYVLVPPHPLVWSRDRSWILHDFKRGASPQMIGVSIPFLKTTCCALSPLDHEVYVGTPGGAVMRVGDPDRPSVYPPSPSCSKQQERGATSDEDNWSD